MRPRSYFLGVLALLLFIHHQAAAQQTIWQVITDPTRPYSFLQVDIQRAYPDIRQVLSNPSSNVTLFAPTEEAFYDLLAQGITLPTGQAMREILLYHICLGALPTNYLITQRTVATTFTPASLGGRSQRASVFWNTTGTTNNVYINNSFIVLPDTPASNGLVHGVSAINFPPAVNVMDTLLAQKSATFNTFVSALTAQGLDTTFRQNGGVTLFAPTDAAIAQFRATQPILYNAIFSDSASLTRVLKYHATTALVYDGEVLPGSTDVTTLDSTPLTVTNTAGVVNVGGAPLLTSNILCSNGVLHTVNKFLLPPGFAATLRQILRGLNLTTMISQMDSNGLSSLLDGATSYTVFAPTNAAFAAADASAVNANVLKYHLSEAGDVLQRSNLTDGMLVDTALDLASLLDEEQKLKVSRIAGGGALRVNSATVVDGDYGATNGIVHIIDSVLSLPVDLVTQLRADPAQYSSLYAALNASGLLSSGAWNAAGLTLFAPTNDAFAKVDWQVLRYLYRPAALSVLQNLLSYHTFNGATDPDKEIYYRKEFPVGVKSLTMASGEAASFNKTAAGGVVINSRANVVVVDTLASNGVMHAVDQVLFPPSFVYDLPKALVSAGANSFLTLLLNSSLAPLLSGSTNYTVFAPSDAALAALQPLPTGDVLTSLLQYHFVRGSVLSSSLANNSMVQTLLYPSGLGGLAQVVRVSFNASGTWINWSNVTLANNTAVNGVVHVIDRVLAPPGDIPSVLAYRSGFTIFNSLVQGSGLQALVQAPNTTVFAPTDAAFGALDSRTRRYLLRPSMQPILRDIVRYHIAAASVLYSSLIPLGTSSIFVSNNSTLTLVKTNTSLTVNGVAVTMPDILASNGVVHAVGTLLLKPGQYDFSLLSAMLEINTTTTFLNAIDSAGMGPMFVTQKKYTVFAPTNSAFGSLQTVPTGAALVQLIQHHLVNGTVLSSALKDDMLLTTNLNLTSLKGNAQRLRVEVDERPPRVVTVNNATVVRYNDLASNGVVHVVNKVLVPPLDILAVAGVLPQNCSTFVYAALFAGLAPIFKRSGLTTFIPNNAAFRDLPKNLLKYLLLGPVAAADLNSFITYHVLNQHMLYSEDFPTQGNFPTQQSQIVKLAKFTGPGGKMILKVNEAFVLYPNALAANGVIHVIDEVLIPPSFQFTLSKLLLALDSALFRAYLTKARLDEYILSTDPITFFVPTDNAFTLDAPNLARLQKNELVLLMANHIVRGKFDNIQPGDRLTTVSGNTLVVSVDENSNNMYVTLEGNVKEDTRAVIIDGANPVINGVAYQCSHVLVREGNEHLEPGTVASIVTLALLFATILVGFGAVTYWKIKNPEYHLFN